MKKLLVVYNPRSSRSERIQEEVLAASRKQKGWMVGRFEMKPLSVTENVAQLAKLIEDGDLVIVAGGDGTASVVANSILLSEKQAVLGVLGYGNFNDMGRMLNGKLKRTFDELVAGFERGAVREVWPLDITVDGKHWRYAMCYVTLGMFAESTRVFDEKKVREKLQKGKHDLLFSMRTLAGWYFKHRKRDFLPTFLLNGEAQESQITDYIAVNSPTMARVLKSRDWSQESMEFGRTVGRLSSLWRLGKFMSQGMCGGMKLNATRQDVLDFAEAASVEIHAEGEYERLEGVKKLEVTKSKRSIRVIRLD